ncbi:MAG TPA: hypothetical protein P5232_01385 [Candidatus Moranbacteria bacterium]|nr:hypothetical protein [Candidatus Moranbacteria bacterium]
MTAKLVVFLAIILFVLFSATFVKGAENIINFEVSVAPNIHSYFDGKNFIVETNNNEAVSITKTDTLLTIVPAL